MQYPTNIKTLDDFYDSLYSIPSRLTRHKTTPKAVTRRLLTALGDPQKSLKSVLVTGSKGKGSSAILLAALLQAAGKKVGLFSSPHLFDFRERIIVNEQYIDPDSLIRIAKQVFTQANRLTIEHPDEFPRFFEITTAIAYCYYAERYVDYAVIETGIGALTDATNQDSHVLSILTNIEIEHLDIFGNIEGLAAEKAGAMLPNVPLILGDLPEEIDQIIIDSAAKLKTPVTRFKRNYLSNNNGFYPIKLKNKTWITDSEVKAKNVWLALTALNKLGVSLVEDEIINTLDKVKIPAREEIISRSPFIIVDSAHTGLSATNLANYVDKNCPSPVRKLVLLVSFSSRKNIAPVLSAFPATKKLVITQATENRSLTPEYIEKAVIDKKLFAEKIKIKRIADPDKALEKTLKKLKPDDVLVITGSVYLAGLISQKLKNYRQTVDH